MQLYAIMIFTFLFQRNVQEWVKCLYSQQRQSYVDTLMQEIKVKTSKEYGNK